MADWWRDDIVDAGKLPLLLCLVAFIVTFVVTRVITRMIRAGRGPFSNNSVGGVHIHHVVPGLVLLTLAGYTLAWVAYNTFLHYGELSGSFDPRISEAIRMTFEEGPHAFVVGGISLVLAVQLLSLGILASQSKRYFEELFHLATSVIREQKRAGGEW